MSKAFNNKIKSFLNQATRGDLNGLAYDPSGAMYFTNGFAVVKLFDTEYTRKQRPDIVCNFPELKDHMQKSVIRVFDDFKTQEFTKPKQVKETTTDFDTLKRYNIYDGSSLHFDYNFILKINKILSNDEKTQVYTSEKNKNAICIVGCNGVAFLLGCRVI